MKRFNSILCVVNTENNSSTAAIQAIKIANDHQAEITFASVLKTSGSWFLAFRDKKEVNKKLQESIEGKRHAIENWITKINPALKLHVEVYAGIEFIEVIKRVVKNQHDLVVKCAENADWLDRLFGSDDMHLLRKCPCPVLMLKPGQTDSFRKILATVDVSEDINEPDKGRVQHQLNKQVLEYSAALCMPELTELHIGCAWEAFAEDFYRYGAFSRQPEEKVDLYVEQERRECSDKLHLLVREMDDRFGRAAFQYLLPRIHLVKGPPSREIPLLAEDNDIELIVMGTVGRTGIPGLIIGNTAESILEQVRCSVLAIKPDGFETPVI